MLLSTNPFIYDNGGGLAVSNELASEFDIKEAVQRDDIYSTIAIGIPKAELYAKLIKIRDENKLDISILEEMSIDEIVTYTGKDPKTAQLAKDREFSVPFILNNQDQAGLVNSLLNDNEHKCIAGKKFYHYTGLHDKGTGILKLKEILKPAKILSVGDGLIDETMFRVSDEAYLVKGADDEFATGFSDGIDYEELDGIGPEGLAELLNRVYR
jgi:mannosyl-3-phosphoglycerate phosphatase